MADQKISQLTDGTSFQSGDEAVVNRSGTNFKVDPTQFGSSIDVTGTVTADGADLDGAVVINESGADVDFRVESDSNANMLFVDGGNNRVGIGTGSPSALLHLSSSGSSATFNITDASGYGAISNSSGSLYLTADRGDVGSKFMSFRVGGTTERMRIDSSGNLLCGSDGGGDIGSSTKRFKDLYLSGGVYLGGTGAANLLDDYEEGTFTPVVADATTGGNTGSATTAGYYTKVGRVVTLNFSLDDIDTTGMTAGNILYIRGLPFAAKLDTDLNSCPSGGVYANYVTLAAGEITMVFDVLDGESHGALRTMISGAIAGGISVGDLASGTANLRISMTYTV